MPYETTEDSLQSSRDHFRRRQAERRWEIHTGCYGTDHRPEESLEDAVRAHLARHKHPAGGPLPAGTVIPWQDGRPSGPPKPLAVELASRRELAVTRAAERLAQDLIEQFGSPPHAGSR
jgi:hypothetical protein